MHRQGYAHFVRSPLRPRPHRLGRHMARAEALDGVYADAHGRGGQGAVRGALLPDRARARRTDRGVPRSPSTRSATRATPSRSCWPRPASWRATPRSSSRSSTSRCRLSSTPSPPPIPTRRCYTSRSARTSLARRLRLGRHRLGAPERRPRGGDRPPALPPFLLYAARMQRRSRQLGSRHRDGDGQLQQPDADVRVDGDRSDARIGQQPAAVLIPGHRRSVRDQDRQLPADRRARAALAQGGAAGQVDRVPDRPHALGRPRQRARVPRHQGGGDEGRDDPRLQDARLRRRRRLSALRAARRGDLVAGVLRLLPLQAHPGRLHRDAHQQVPDGSQPRATRASSTSG